MKKIIIGGAVLVVAFVLVAAILVKNSNKLIKEKIEASLGKNVNIQELSLSWGGVDAIGVQVMQDKTVIAKADRIGIKADFLGFLKQGIALSSLTLERPYLQLQIDANGEYINPFASSGAAKKDEGKPAESTMFAIGSIAVRDGEIAMIDRRKVPDMQAIGVKKIALEFRDLVYPLADTSSRIDFSAVMEGRFIAGTVKVKGDVNLKTKALQLTFDGQQLVLLDSREKGAAAKSDSAHVVVASDKTKPGRYNFAEFSLVRPSLRVERDRTGEFVNPFLAVEAAKTPPAKKNAETAAKETSNEPTLLFQKIHVSEGIIDYFNGMVAIPPHHTRIEAVSLMMDNVSLPATNDSSNYVFSANIQNGSVSSKGVTALQSKDTKGTVTVRNLDITKFKPYFQKKGDADLVRGTMNLDMDLSIKSRILNAPGRVVLKNLAFATGGGTGAAFLGVPRNIVLTALQTGNNEIAFDMKLEGNLDDPKFSVREGLMKRLTAGLADKLGVGVAEMGGAVIGAGKQGVEQIGKGAQGIGEGLRKMFKK